MRRYLTEFVGTFFLVLAIGLSTAPGAAGPMAPLAIGAMLMVMVYAGGHISGAHYNPAVTLAIFLRKKLPGSDVAPYWIVQFFGAVAAALTVWWITGAAFVPPMPGVGVGPWMAVLIEAIFTLALALVVLQVATTKATERNSYYGLAIGFTVTAGAYCVGHLSGGAFNPAVGLGPAIVHVLRGGSDPHCWVYLVGPCFGAIVAAIVYRAQHAGTAEVD